jgi:hypothetical protein
MTITRRTGSWLRSLLLAGALALALIPALESRASAATYGLHYYCAASASSDQSTWVPPNSYCQRGTGGQPAQLVGSFTRNEVGGPRTNQRRCAIIDVYSTTTGLQVKRYKACTAPGEWSKTVQMTNGEYLNQNKYIMFASVYNGSSTRQNLGGTAFGYRY